MTIKPIFTFAAYTAAIVFATLYFSSNCERGGQQQQQRRLFAGDNGPFQLYTFSFEVTNSTLSSIPVGSVFTNQGWSFKFKRGEDWIFRASDPLNGDAYWVLSQGSRENWVMLGKADVNSAVMTNSTDSIAFRSCGLNSKMQAILDKRDTLIVTDSNFDQIPAGSVFTNKYGTYQYQRGNYYIFSTKGRETGFNYWSLSQNQVSVSNRIMVGICSSNSFFAATMTNATNHITFKKVDE